MIIEKSTGGVYISRKKYIYKTFGIKKKSPKTLRRKIVWNEEDLILSFLKLLS